MHVKKKTMYVLFVCRTAFPNAGTKCACLDWWFINSRFSSVKPRTFTSLEGGGVLRSTGIWLNLSEKKKRGGGWLCRIFFPLVQIVTNSCGIKRKGQTLTNSVIICKKSNNLTHVPSIFYLEQECLCTVQCMKCKPDKNTCHRKIWSLYYFVDIGISAVSNFFPVDQWLHSQKKSCSFSAPRFCIARHCTLQHITILFLSVATNYLDLIYTNKN